MPVCAIYGCKSRQLSQKNVPEELKLRFFSIPTVITNQGDETRELSKERRRLWKAAINRKDIQTQTEKAWDKTVVCSKHFVDGHKAYLHLRNSPSWLPTLHLGYDALSASSVHLSKERYSRLIARKKKSIGELSSPVTCKRTKTIMSRKASDFTELETVIKQENQDIDDDIVYRQQQHEMVANILEQKLEIETMDEILKTVIKEEKEENIEEFHENHQNEMFARDFKQTPEIPANDRKIINFSDDLKMVIKKEQPEMGELVNRNQPQVDVKKAKKAANPDANVKIINRFYLQNYTNTIEPRNKSINNQKNCFSQCQ